ncbi:hypothetical protein HZH66_009336 [Vespula vulgaris]|uniref:Uncharacterized protein n=1 Tax=Vespula vulgaris TaxID=7454 RepID=A0A834JST3_VESVU|nr:hypothetical protein HZH66_009336 [Vespula vulgaris]
MIHSPRTRLSVAEEVLIPCWVLRDPDLKAEVSQSLRGVGGEPELPVLEAATVAAAAAAAAVGDGGGATAVAAAVTIVLTLFDPYDEPYDAEKIVKGCTESASRTAASENVARYKMQRYDKTKPVALELSSIRAAME